MRVKVRVTVEKVLEIPVLNFNEAVDVVRNNMTLPDGTVSILMIDEKADGTREFRSIV